MVKTNWKVLILSLLVVLGLAFIGSLFTAGNANSSWYLENKPFFTPPSFVFPIAWSILYFLIALSLYFAWIKAKKANKKKIAAAFGINLFTNVLWSYLFFGLRNPLFAFFDLLVLWITIVWMIVIVEKIDRKAGWLLVPYLLWVSFAGFLNFAFMIPGFFN